MGSVVPLLSDRVRINRALILIGGALITLIGFINNRIHPGIDDPFVLRLTFTLISYVVLVLSYTSSIGQKYFLLFCNFLYFILIVLFQYIIVLAQFHPVYVFGSYLVFIGISLGINHLPHLKIYLAVYFISALTAVYFVKSPLYPVFNYLFQLFVLSILIYVLIKSYLGFQKTLEISNQHFQTLINNADECYFLIDDRFKLLKINTCGKDFVKSKYGFDIEEGSDINKLFAKEELDFLIRNSQKAFKGESIILERLIVFPDSNRWYEIKFIPVYGNSDTSKVLISALDITSKKKILDNLRESEAKFRIISDFSPLGIYLFNKEGKVNYVNNNFCQITGIDKESFTNSDWTKGIIRSDQSKIRELYENSVGSLQEFNSLIRYHHRERGIIWINYRAAPIFFSDRHYGYVATLEDITELKHANDNLRKSERQFRELFENAPIGMVLCSLDGVVLNINQALLEMFGIGKEELIDQGLFEQLIPAKFEGNSYLNHLVKNGRKDQYEKSFTNISAKTVSTIISVTVFNDHVGKPLFVLFQILDISSRKESEKLLEQKNNELLKINSELDAFVYSAAHDLRAPLTSILGVVNLVRMENSNPDLKKYLDLVDQSVKKLDNFIGDIIDYSRNARTEIRIEEIDAYAFISQSFEDLSYTKEAQSITRIIEVKEGQLIYTDKRRLQIIINNLIGNSIRYHDRRKDEKFIRIKLNVENNLINIEEEDNGIGIEHKYLDKIFNMFFRASETSKGSGLGLYIVKEAINKLEGEIKVESKYGSGTRFLLKIPNGKMEQIKVGEQISSLGNAINF